MSTAMMGFDVLKRTLRLICSVQTKLDTGTPLGDHGPGQRNGGGC